MADSKFTLRTLTPDNTLYEELVDMVIFRTVSGDMGVLAGHEPSAVSLIPGEMLVRTDGNEERFIISGGYAVVDRDKVTVMSEIAERADRMEALLQEMEQLRQKRRTDSQAWSSDVTRAEVAIRRILMGQETSAYSIIKGKGDEGEEL